MEKKIIADIIQNIDIYSARVEGSKFNFRKVPLTDEHEKIPLNKLEELYREGRLKTPLLDHQRTIVKAMIELEGKRVLFKENDKSEGYKFKYNAGVLSDPPGSGKTIDVLALIVLSPKPKILPDILRFGTAAPYIIRAKYDTILQPTLIFVNRSVLIQWERAITQFTDLTCFVVRDVKNLRAMVNMIENKSLKYDIVLVKNNVISVDMNMTFRGNDVFKKEHDIYNIIALLNQCWMRCVIDDFDTIGLPAEHKRVNAVFTWIISATQAKLKCASVQNGLQTMQHLQGNITNEMKDIYESSNALLFNSLNLKNHPDYLLNINDIPAPEYFVYNLPNPNEQIISALRGSFDGIVNMINADAIRSASLLIGSDKKLSVASIFEYILGKEYAAYSEAEAVLQFISWVEAAISDLSKINFTHAGDFDSAAKLLKAKMNEFEAKLPRGARAIGVIKNNIRAHHGNHKDICASARQKYGEIYKKTSQNIERIKTKLKENECPVCYENIFVMKKGIINKCCGCILCLACGIMAQFSTKIGELRPNMKGRCVMCRYALKTEDVVQIDENMAMNITKSEAEVKNAAEAEAAEEKNAAVEVAVEPPASKRTKESIFINIILGKKEICASARAELPMLLTGSAKLPNADRRKFLVFANYEETLDNVVNSLKKHNIKYWMLGGTYLQISRIIDTFAAETENCVLLINSIKFSSGLNLQMATDIIFLHSVAENDEKLRKQDEASETQIIGRAMRIGRKNGLKIHYILYDNELKFKKNIII